jgi:hypothetical protein
MRATSRILLSFCSLLLAVAIFSAILGKLESWLFIFKVTLLVALPVWTINLLILFLFKNDRNDRWIVPALGALIGPVCLTLWSGVLVLRGSNWLSIWNGDPEAGGLKSWLICASLIGLGTNSFYTLALALRKPHTVPRSAHDHGPGADSPSR